MSIKQGRCGFYHVDVTIPGGQRIRHSAGTTDRKEAQEYHDALRAKLLGQTPPTKQQRIDAYRIDVQTILSINIPANRLVVVYFLVDQGEVVYVGKTTDLFGRISAHLREKRMSFSAFSFVEVDIDILDEVEIKYIVGLAPRYNTSNNAACLNRLRKHRAATANDAELHQWVVQWAKENHRSMNGQILAKLDEIRQEQHETVTPPVPSKDKAA